ncbi:MAG: hypothetical protein U1C74_00045, partial [Phenylobacterium sp.]|nr:hypothetical protein [Phenylobacterium sp.]
TVLTAEGMIGPEAAMPAAALGLLAVTLATLGMLRASRLVAFGVPVVWGLVAVWVAERDDQALIGIAAIAAAVVIGLYMAWLARPTARTH